MADLGDQLTLIRDKHEMHKLIDELPPEGIAILAAVRCGERGNGGSYVLYGTRVDIYDALGLIEYAKASVSDSYFHNAREARKSHES